MSHNLVSVIWRPRKAGSVIHLESVGLRNEGVDAGPPNPRLKA